MSEREPIQDHKEWVSHQYDPGHYTGGHVQHWATHKKNRKPLGIVIFVLGLLMVCKAIYDLSVTGFDLGTFVSLCLGSAFAFLALRALVHRKS